MSIIRVKKTDNFTTISNIALRDKQLSIKAKGLWAVMMSCNDGWQFSIEGLVGMSADGKDAVRSGLKELEKAGYLVRTHVRDKGKFSYEYTVYETPHAENRDGKPDAENPTQRNTNKEIPNKKSFIAPTKAEVQAYCHSQGYHFNPDDFFDYYQASGWHKADGKAVRNWKQCCVTWESKWKEKHPNATAQTKERRKKLT